ncbi:MAG: ATP synthase F1 subunit delta [Alphaproteobacteria bacterium]|nr:MAG: ATP synthase F1 subunit delta [Alphaproteobacteria bacterium]
MTAASRYANALFALAQDANAQQPVAAAVATLATAVEDASVAAALANPRLSPAQRTQLAASMAKAVNAPQALANTLGVLAANNRLSVLAAVLRSYQSLHDASFGVTHVQLATATPLTEAQRTKLADLIRKQAKSSDVRIDETVDASLKGGFRAFFNGQVWDASLSGQLARISTRLRSAITQRHSQN